MDEVYFIESEIKKGKMVMNISQLAFHISNLAGLLRIHLLQEDKFLYPTLMNCSDLEIQQMADEYAREMGDISAKYIEFKNSYNVSSKINAKMDLFIEEAQAMIKALKTRMQKEEQGLYHLVKIKNL
jgi:hemerythrin-like domain-containing protein